MYLEFTDNSCYQKYKQCYGQMNVAESQQTQIKLT